MPPAAALPNVQEQGGIPDPMAQAKAMYTKVAISLSRKSLQHATVCASVSITLGRGERLHVIEVIICLRQE